MDASHSIKDMTVCIPDDHQYHIDSFVIPPNYSKYLESIIVPNGLIMNRIQKMAANILSTLAAEEIHFICILKGSFRFFNHLIESINNIRTHQDQSANKIVHYYHFVRVKSYVDTEIGGLNIDHFNLGVIRGKVAVIVDDILDTGNTLTQFIMKLQQEVQPKDIRLAVLFQKRLSINAPVIHTDYTGFTIPNHFAVGFGLDYSERFRELDHLCIINDLGKEEFQMKK